MRIADRNLRNWDLVDALDVQDMLDVGELILTASLSRQERRGPFHREDFPRPDTVNWLKRIVAQRVNSTRQERLLPVATAYVTPADAKADFLSSEY